MPPPETITSFTELFADLQLDILEHYEHQCPFRTLLAHVLKSDVRESITTFMSGVRLSFVLSLVLIQEQKADLFV